MKRSEEILNNNGEWLDFISDLEDIACFLNSNHMDSNAENIRTAIALLIAWNPKRRKSLKEREEK